MLVGSVKVPVLRCNSYTFQQALLETVPLRPVVKYSFSFADLFAGIGGFHLACKNLGGKCNFACEIDEHARQTYIKNHKIDGNIFAGDITQINPSEIPDHDLLCAGFPCQPFSQCGLKKGFEDTRGTLFFYIAEIIHKKRPRAFFLENVRHLVRHNEGKTFERIRNILEGLGYSFDYKIVQASEFGLPQHRPRLFMVGFRDSKEQFCFPEKEPLKLTMSDVMGGKCNREIGFTLRVSGRGSKIDDRHNWDGYVVDGAERRLTPKEGLKMMGFPDDFVLPTSVRQAMKQLGNSVAVPAIQRTVDRILQRLCGEL